VNFLDDLILEPNAFYRGYLDFERLYHMDQCLSFFVLREKQNFNHRRVDSRKGDNSKGFNCDQAIKLKGVHTSSKYQKMLRRIKYFDKEETGKNLVFLTNNFAHNAETITKL